jgi:hypothetical protein
MVKTLTTMIREYQPENKNYHFDSGEKVLRAIYYFSQKENSACLLLLCKDVQLKSA